MPIMDGVTVSWDLFKHTAQSTGFVDMITQHFDTTALIGILAGVTGITVAFTLIWRFAAYIRRMIIGAMTNSKKRRGN